MNSFKVSYLNHVLLLKCVFKFYSNLGNKFEIIIFKYLKSILDSSKFEAFTYVLNIEKLKI